MELLNLKFSTREARLRLEIFEVRQEQRVVNIRSEMDKVKEHLKVVKLHRDDREIVDLARVLRSGAPPLPLNIALDWQNDEAVAGASGLTEEKSELRQSES